MRTCWSCRLVMQVLVKKMFRVYNMAMEFAVSSRGHRRRHVLCRGAACWCLAEAALNAPGWLWQRDQGSGQLAAQAAKWIQGQCRFSRNADAKPHEDKASMEPQPTTSKIKVLGTSTISLNQQISFKGNGQKQADILVRRSCEDRSSIEPGVTDGTSSQSGIVDQSHYILCLLESESPEDHQIAVEMILGDERFHIATLPTSDQAKKFVDQFILLHLDLLIYDLQEGVKEQLLSRHSDRLVIAFGLLNTSPTTRLVVIKNLRVCVD
ncbi:Pentatricopeptide repeat-containing protein [Hordeum vulgare]|nr:Pentatricopeptide repeat-containing protein [Hordeum vulgare]